MKLPEIVLLFVPLPAIRTPSLELPEMMFPRFTVLELEPESISTPTTLGIGLISVASDVIPIRFPDTEF